MTELEQAREQSIIDEPKVKFFANGQATIGAYSEDSLRNQFEAGAEWMKRQTEDAFIEKACAWLSNTDFCHYYNKMFIEEFKTYMKGE